MIMKTIDNATFVDKVVAQLRRTAIDLEEFQVKASLGKAEATDKYEEIKKKFNLFIHETKNKIELGKEKITDMNTMFDELIVQLALGKAESKEAFKEQKKKLLHKLHDIEVKIKTNETLNSIYAYVLIEIEMFRVQLEILEKNFEKGKDGVKTAFEKSKKEFNEMIEKIKSKYSGKKKETQWEHFQNEISEAFGHFRQAFSKA